MKKILVLAAILAPFSLSAYAHDYPIHRAQSSDGYSPGGSDTMWLDKHSNMMMPQTQPQFNGHGENRHCCGKGDCTQVDPKTVKVTGEGYQLPNGMIIPYAETQVSEDEFFWFCQFRNDLPQYGIKDGDMRCFFAPGSGV